MIGAMLLHAILSYAIAICTTAPQSYASRPQTIRAQSILANAFYAQILETTAQIMFDRTSVLVQSGEGKRP
eukprot:7254-Heterococcus_DN1.PRE.1